MGRCSRCKAFCQNKDEGEIQGDLGTARRDNAAYHLLTGLGGCHWRGFTHFWSSGQTHEAHILASRVRARTPRSREAEGLAQSCTAGEWGGSQADFLVTWHWTAATDKSKWQSPGGPDGDKQRNQSQSLTLLSHLYRLGLLAKVQADFSPEAPRGPSPQGSRHFLAVSRPGVASWVTCAASFWTWTLCSPSSHPELVGVSQSLCILLRVPTTRGTSEMPLSSTSPASSRELWWRWRFKVTLMSGGC